MPKRSVVGNPSGSADTMAGALRERYAAIDDRRLKDDPNLP